MNQLLANVLDAHGGLNRWNNYQKVEASIVTGGGFFDLKGMLQDSTPRRMSVWLHEERSSVLPFGAPDQRTMFTPERIAIEKLDGTVVAEHCRRFSSGATDLKLCGSERNSSPNQKARIHTRARPAADPGDADGLHRFQRGAFRIAERLAQRMHSHLGQSRLVAIRVFLPQC
jgi:hypothetical protein